MNADERRWLTVERRHCPGRFQGRYDAFISRQTLWNIPKSFGQQNGTELLLGSTANEGTQLLPPAAGGLVIPAKTCGVREIKKDSTQMNANSRRFTQMDHGPWHRRACTGAIEHALR